MFTLRSLPQETLALPLTLPEPRHGRLARSPLQLVACQLRYAEATNPMSAALCAEIAANLVAAGYAYPKVEQITLAGLSLNISPTGLQSAQPTPGTAYRLVSEDGRWIVTLAQDSISLETPHYGTWSGEFRDRYLATMRVATDKLRPAVSLRQGLRYVDILADNDVRNIRDWQARVRDEFLGPLRNDAYADGTLLTQQQLTLQLADSLRAVLRHGAFFDREQEPSIRYLIDTDVYRESFDRFDLAQLEAILEPMHKAAKQLFQSVITDEYYERLAAG